MATRHAPMWWRDVVPAGLLAGTLFLFLLMILQPFVGNSPFEVLRMIAAIPLGPAILTPPITFVVGFFVAAMAVHFALAVIFTVPVAALVRGLAPESALAVGAGYGAALYAVNFYVFTLLFPWFAAGRTPVTAVAHVVFGTLAAYFYRIFVLRTVARLRTSGA